MFSYVDIVTKTPLKSDNLAESCPLLDRTFWQTLIYVADLVRKKLQSCSVSISATEAVPIQLVRSLPSVTNYGSDAGGSVFRWFRKGGCDLARGREVLSEWTGHPHKTN